MGRLWSPYLSTPLSVTNYKGVKKMKKMDLEKIKNSLCAYLDEIYSSLSLSDSDIDKVSDFVTELQEKIENSTNEFIELYELKD